MQDAAPACISSNARLPPPNLELRNVILQRSKADIAYCIYHLCRVGDVPSTLLLVVDQKIPEARLALRIVREEGMTMSKTLRDRYRYEAESRLRDPSNFLNISSIYSKENRMPRHKMVEGRCDAPS